MRPPEEARPETNSQTSSNFEATLPAVDGRVFSGSDSVASNRRMG